MLLSCQLLRTEAGGSILPCLIVSLKMSSAVQHARSASSSSSPQGLTHDPRPVASHFHRLSAIVPPDAPIMTIRCSVMLDAANDRWFYATDVPKKKLVPDSNDKPKAPTKWTAFTPRDSKALEAAFQKSIANPSQPVPTVPVNEDHLFEVDIAQRELRPIYFRGSTYEANPHTFYRLIPGTKSRMVFSRRFGIETV